MLTKIGLENFKSWRSLDLDLSNLTILFGTNSSGKTSVLQSLLLLKQTVMGFDQSLPINFGGGEQDYVDFGDYRELVFNHDETKPIGITLVWIPSHIAVVEVNLNREGSASRIDLFSHSVHWQKNGDSIVTDETKPRNPVIRVPATPDTITIVSPKYFDPLMVLMQQIAYLGPLRSYPQRNYLWRGATPQELGPRGEKTIDVLLASERGQESLLGQVQHWLIQMELVKDFQIKPIDEGKRFYEPRVKVGDEPVESSLMDAGFGISQVLPIITLLFSVPEYSIVLIEQPELHLHPSAQAHLADLFLHVAETRNLQLIVESHSEHLLRRLQRRIAEPEAPFADLDHIKMYFCELGEEGSAVRPVEVNQYGQIANWPENFFGDLSGDLEAMTKAGLQRRRQELANDR